MALANDMVSQFVSDDLAEMRAELGITNDIVQSQAPPPPNAAAPVAPFRVVGMTMAVPNPDYKNAVAQRTELLLRQKTTAIARDQAKTLRYDALNMPSPVNLDYVYEQFYRTFGSERWILVPQEIIDDRSLAVKNKIKAAFALYALAAKNNLINGLTDVQQRKFADLVTRLIQQFAGELIRFEFHRVPITKSHVQDQFAKLLDNIAKSYYAQQMVYVDPEELQLYQLRLVEENVIPEMDAWKDEWFRTHANASAGQRDIIETQVAALRANTDADIQAARQKSLEDADVSFGNIENDVTGIVTAIQQGVAENASESEYFLPAYIAAKKIAEQEWIRTLANSVIIPQTVEINAIDAKLSNIQPTLQVPLVIQRRADNTGKLTFAVSVEPTSGIWPAEALTFEFSLEESKNETEVPALYEAERSSGKSHTFFVNPTGKTTLYKAVCDIYRANNTRYGRFESETATVLFVAQCLRCNAVYSPMERRVFGECLWRKHPITRELKTALETSGIIAAAGRLAVQFCGIDLYLDDSVTDKDDVALVTPNELIVLGFVGRTELIRRYFAYDAVLRNMNRRAEAEETTLIDIVRTAFTEVPELDANKTSVQQYADRAMFFASKKAANATKIIENLPVWSVLYAFLQAPNVADVVEKVAKKSELRFLRDIETRFSAFVDLFSSYSATARAATASLGRVVFFGRSGNSALRVGETITVEARHEAGLALGTMTSREIAYNDAWLVRDEGHNMFIDVVGLNRLMERIRVANEETRVLDRTYLRPDQYATERNGLSALQQAWRDVQGRAASAKAFLTPIAIAVNQSTKDMVDWRDVHSYETDQPTPYRIERDENEEIVLRRGSERLRGSVDFAAMHRTIVELGQKLLIGRASEADVINAVENYNVLAFFGPHAGTKRKNV